MSATLPPGFEALEPFATRWAGDTAADRARLRDDASFEDATAFYACAQPLLEPALRYLDATPLTDHGEAQRRLMRLMLALGHVAMGVEVQREAEPMHARFRTHMRITRAPADAP